MTDNTDEENPDNPASIQSGNPVDKIITSDKIDTINQNQETKNMEVHHHPDIHHKSKPWKEYLLEGLMIFLAVTMGFFAESFREYR